MSGVYDRKAGTGQPFFGGYEAYNIFICIYIYIYIGLVSSKQGGGFKCF